MKVLLSAYACLPDSGSEPGIGWTIAQELARHHDVWVVTRGGNKATIEKAVANNPLHSLHFLYYDLGFWSSPQPNSSGFLLQLHYYLWQIAAQRYVRHLHLRIRFDIAQHVTYGRYWMPSALRRLRIPVVWGPVGGGESSPIRLTLARGWKGFAEDSLRSIVRRVGEFDPAVWQTSRNCSIALASTMESASRLRRMKARRVEVFGACGLSRAQFEWLCTLGPPPEAPFRFISAGRLLHWKGFDMGLEAFARASIEGAEYWIVGDGPERERLRGLARSLGIEKRVIFCGRLSHGNTLRTMAQCHVLVHPSLHDSGGFVCIEAMALGRPTICLAVGGPASIISGQTGIKVEPRSHPQVVEELALAMHSLARNRELRESMGRKARARTEKFFSWDKKISHLLALYSEIKPQNKPARHHGVMS